MAKLMWFALCRRYIQQPISNARYSGFKKFKFPLELPENAALLFF
jgi:hypothetical protein